MNPVKLVNPVKLLALGDLVERASPVKLLALVNLTVKLVALVNLVYH